MPKQQSRCKNTKFHRPTNYITNSLYFGQLRRELPKKTQVYALKEWKQQILNIYNFFLTSCNINRGNSYRCKLELFIKI